MGLIRSLYVLFMILLMSCSNWGTNKIQQLSNGNFSISSDDKSFIIDPGLGARIISAKIKEDELLLQERDSLVNWGSTFWLAPQRLWDWPPPEAIHLGKYQSKIREGRLLLTSDIDAKFGCRVSKEFYFDEERKRLAIEYQIINDTDFAQQFGPWEITVVPAEGAKVFFPLGEEPSVAKSNIDFEHIHGIGWFQYDQEKLDEWHKLFNNGSEGWLAYISGKRTLFIKSFELISPPDIAPGQGNIEVYINKKFKYIELENHGRYTLLQPGTSLSYQVSWYISKIPESILTDKFSNDLIDYVRRIVYKN